MKSQISNLSSARRLRWLALAAILLAALGIAARTLIDLQSQVQGILPVANGGTGASSLASANLPTQSGAFTTGNCIKAAGANSIQDAGAPCGTGSGGAALYGSLASLIQMPNYETKGPEGQVVAVAGGASQALLSLPAGTSGTVLSVWIAENNLSAAQSQIKVSTDGASSPQATFEFSNLGGYNAPTNSLASYFRGSYFHGSGTGGTVYLRWPIYFRDGVDIEFANVSGATSANIWWIVNYTTDFTSDLRLHTSFVSQNTPVSGLNLATTTYDFLNQATNTGIATASVNSGGSGGYLANDVIYPVQSGAVGGALKVTSVSGGAITGLSVYTAGGGFSTGTGLATYGGHGTGATVNIGSVGANSPALIGALYLAAVGAVNFTYLEADVNLYLDGEGTPSYKTSGTEDFFTSAGYFNNGTRLQTPWMFQNATVSSGVAALIDLLDYYGGLKFSNGGILRWDGVTNDSGRITSTVSFSYDLLFYQ